MDKKRLLLFLTVFFMGIIRLLFLEQESTSVILINEVCSRNVAINCEKQYRNKDYIELYNCSDKDVSLNGWYLSDDSKNLKLQSLPDITIKAKDFLVLCADGSCDTERSLGFKVSHNGENLFLSNPDGEVVDQVYVPKLQIDQAYGRVADGSKQWEKLSATPEVSNKTAVIMSEVILEMPKASHPSGFYQEEFVLTLQADAGQKIYYTTDGSIPDTNATLYTDGILIKNNTDQPNVINDVRNIVADWKDYYISGELADKACVIRAIAVDEKENVSDVWTATYFVDLEKFKDCNVISLTADPQKLIGEDGIFITGKNYDEWYLSDSMSMDGHYEEGWTTNYELTNFWQCDRSSEVMCNIEIFNAGDVLLNQKAGIQTQGNYNRMRPKKSLQIFARNVYTDDKVFDTTVFKEYNSHAIYISAVPDKAYYLELAKDRSLDIQQSEPYAVFINGEYWYSAAVMEKYDATYFSQHYGIDEGNVLFVKDTISTVGEEYGYLYEDLINYLRDESVTQEEKAEFLYESCDVQSFIDWMCFNLYIGNDDISYKKNSTLWRAVQPDGSAYGDGKWRWMLFDIDHATIGIPAETTDFQSFPLVTVNRFYWAFKTNPEFCQQFVLTMMDMMNSIFLPENIENVLKKWDREMSGYFLIRPEYMIQSLVNEFGISGNTGVLSVSSNESTAGKISVNTIDSVLEDSGFWRGEYFIDYPITVTAKASPGYRFVQWSGDYESAEETLEVQIDEDGVVITAIFEKE